MEKFQLFEEWLKAKHQLNWRENIIHMTAMDKVLMVPNFEKIASVSILTQMLSALKKNVSFASKPKTERDKELKTFKLYIQFLEEEKVLKST